MRQKFGTATCASIALAATSLVAQTAGSPTPQRAGATHSVTIIGCVQRSDQTATGGSVTTPMAVNASTKFVLTAATRATSSATATSG